MERESERNRERKRKREREKKLRLEKENILNFIKILRIDTSNFPFNQKQTI